MHNQYKTLANAIEYHKTTEQTIFLCDLTEMSVDDEGFDELQIKRLEEIVNEFEYFNTARILLLKAYHDKEHFAFNDLLSKTSLASQNREKLFELIFHIKENYKNIFLKALITNFIDIEKRTKINVIKHFFS